MVAVARKKDPIGAVAGAGRGGRADKGENAGWPGDFQAEARGARRQALHDVQVPLRIHFFAYTNINQYIGQVCKAASCFRHTYPKVVVFVEMPVEITICFEVLVFSHDYCHLIERALPFQSFVYV